MLIFFIRLPEVPSSFNQSRCCAYGVWGGGHSSTLSEYIKCHLNFAHPLGIRPPPLPLGNTPSDQRPKQASFNLLHVLQWPFFLRLEYWLPGDWLILGTSGWKSVVCTFKIYTTHIIYQWKVYDMGFLKMSLLTSFMLIYANEDSFSGKIIIFDKIHHETLKCNSINSQHVI